MKLAVKGRPHIHEAYGFSVQVQSITPVGSGAIKKAAQLLAKKLEAEGLFDPSRKRVLPYPPQTIGLITSQASAAYADFVKVLGARYGGLTIYSYDTQVQGEAAISDIINAVKYFNELAQSPECLVITRGGGSAEDLAAFSNEHVVRAVAASRIPTLVAIGHEVDTSLAELAADAHASTPSNAAELLVPHKHDLQDKLQVQQKWLAQQLGMQLTIHQNNLLMYVQNLQNAVQTAIKNYDNYINQAAHLLQVFSPQAALKRGYALVRSGGKIVTSTQQVKSQQQLHITLADGSLQARVE